MRTLVGIYETLDNAIATVEELHEAGIDRNNIILVARRPKEQHNEYLDRAEHAEVYQAGSAEEAAEGAAKGGVLGGVTGAAAGLVALAIPGIGPAVALGPLAAAVAGGAIGAASGGLLGALVEGGLSRSEAREYVDSIRRHQALVAVKVMEYQEKAAEDVLHHHYPVDVNTRDSMWHKDVWMSDKVEAPTPETRDLYVPVFADYEPLFQEHWRETYGHRAGIGLDYDTFLPAYHYGYELAVRPEMSDYDDWEEVAVAARPGWEESHDTLWDDVKDAVHHAWLEIKEEFRDEGIEYDDRRDPNYGHYNQTYEAAGIPFDRYESAYRFGELLAKDIRYRDREWEDIEFPVRQRWEHDHPVDGSWSEVKDAVRHAWERAREDPDSIEQQHEAIVDSE